MSRIAALQSDGDASIVSRPSILTVDNMGALVDISETFYIQSTGERVAEVTPISVGVTLRVTPRIIEQSGTPGSAYGGRYRRRRHSGPEGPEPADRAAQHRRHAGCVAEQSSLLIGGFDTERNLRQKDAVPGLGEVPALGLLFGKKRDEVQKRERLFLITPKIVPSPVLAAANR